MVSALAFVYAFILLCGCTSQRGLRNSLAETNFMSGNKYHIELVAHNALATLAYKTDVLHHNGCAQWDGTAMIGAYNMAFEQRCISLYANDICAKQWRGQWVSSTATSPKNQIDKWLQDVRRGAGTITEGDQWFHTEADAEGRSDSCITVQMPRADLDWNALADVHIDSIFGTQSLLTAFEQGSVTLYFDAETHQLSTVVIAADTGQNSMSCIITVSTTEEQIQETIPTADKLKEGTLYEEWTILDPGSYNESAK